MNAMRNDGAAPDTVRVDGGMVNNNWLAQYLANILDIAVERPPQTETTALGAAYLAGLQTGVYQSLDELTANRQQERKFTPDMNTQLREQVLNGWSDAVRRTRSG
jgi:glycerol kinase